MTFDRTVSAIIITRNRPHMVRDCLEHLERQTLVPDEVIVVDSSSNDDTQSVLDEYPQVRRLRILNARNNRPQAKNLGIVHARGEILAFLDDDSMAQPDWLRHLSGPYDDPKVGGVGGRVIDLLEVQRADGTGQIGAVGLCYVRPNFHLDPGGPVEVDSFLGCNMSFQRRVLTEIGGFDPHFTGGNQLEETDVCVRVKAAGYSLIFEPRAVVEHLSLRSRNIPKYGPGLGFRFHQNKNWAYFLAKNYGHKFRVLCNLFGGVPWLKFAQFVRSPSIDRLNEALTILPGSLCGFTLGLFYRWGFLHRDYLD